MAKLELKKLARTEQVLLGAGVVALIALFLPWYGFSSSIYSASVSGWSTSYGWLGGLLIILGAVLLALLRAEVKLPTLPVGPAVLILSVSLLGTLIVALRWLTLPSGSVAGGAYSYGPQAGIVIALLAGVVETVAAYLLFRASGEPLPWAEGGFKTAAKVPGAAPGAAPGSFPSSMPTASPTPMPTASPSPMPSPVPTASPGSVPTADPGSAPTVESETTPGGSGPSEPADGSAAT